MARWLEVGVRTNGVGAFSMISPRQQVLATPYAITAANLSGPLVASGLSGTYSGAVTLSNVGNFFTGNGGGLSGLNASQLINGIVPDAVLGNAWKLGGNSGTAAGTHFLGTTDNQPLEFKIAGGHLNRVGTNAAFGSIGGGFGNSIGTGSSYATIAGGGPNDIGTESDYSVIGGGSENNIAAYASDATIAGGKFNDIGTSADSSVIGGGSVNNIGAYSFYASIVGGYRHDLGTYSSCSAIGGGSANSIGAYTAYATIAGGRDNRLGTNSSNSVIGGGSGNIVSSNSANATIAGGYNNFIGENSFYSTVGGGSVNTVASNSSFAMIAGGYGNGIRENSSHALIGGGFGNTVGANADFSTITGGNSNSLGENSSHGAIGGGSGNTILTNSAYATIPGGLSNTATNLALASGRQAKAIHTGSFVWGDSTPSNVVSVASNSVTMRASGGYRLFSNAATNAGVSLAANGTSWSVISDRNVKKDFAPVDSREVLEKLAALPITKWHYNWEQSGETPHVGPMAQDFKAAFYPGRDDKSITTLEADGVALAAIQGLNQKVEEREASLRSELKRRDAENADLKSRLEKLERMLEAKGGAE